jgi:general secretion pathway protein A
MRAMYASYFGLKHEPFSIAPDPRYLFMSERHREALAHLLYGVRGGGGFVLLSGEIGAGKTTVCRCFLEQIPAGTNVAYVFNPKLSVIELLASVCEEFDVPRPAPPPDLQHAGPPTVKDLVDPLNAFLLQAHARGENNVLIIDEAQNLSADVLEQLRLLTNLETNERKLLQIILIGQPELRTMLARPELEQLAQRVIARYHLDSLSERESLAYIAHRLSVAGLEGALPFDSKALQRIHQRARGVPRRINLLCDRALLGAYATGKRQVDAAIVDRAAAEVFGRPVAAASKRRRPASVPALAGGALAGVALLAGAQWAWSWRDAHGGTASAAAGVGARGASAATHPATGATTSIAAAGPAPARPTSGAAVAPAAGIPVASAASTAALASAGVPGTAASVPGFPPLAAPAASGVLLTGPADLAAAFGAPWRDERAAWRELATAWGVTLPVEAGDPCTAAVHAGLGCFRGHNNTLALVRALDRPAVVTLHDAADAPVYALLVALGPDTATLQANGVRHTVPLATLASMWRGEFATLWRLPPGYAGPLADGARGPAVDRLAASLAAARHENAPPAGQSLDAALRGRLFAFQLTQGLQPDGVAGPTTFMQLNRAGGVPEPRLSGGS